jgi:hypothetical protein
MRTTTRRLLHSASFDLTWRDIDEWDENVEAVRWAIELAAEEVPSIDMPGLFYQDSVQTRSIPNQTKAVDRQLGAIYTRSFPSFAQVVFSKRRRESHSLTVRTCIAEPADAQPIPSHPMPCHAMPCTSREAAAAWQGQR